MRVTRGLWHSIQDRPTSSEKASIALDGRDRLALRHDLDRSDQPMAFLRFAVRMKATGREASFHLHHYFRFGGDGKVKCYRGSEDSAQVAFTTSSGRRPPARSTASRLFKACRACAPKLRPAACEVAGVFVTWQRYVHCRTEPPEASEQKESPAMQGFRDAPERTRTSTDHSVHKALNLARLPIPPQALEAASIAPHRSLQGFSGVDDGGRDASAWLRTSGSIESVLEPRYSFEHMFDCLRIGAPNEQGADRWWT